MKKVFALLSLLATGLSFVFAQQGQQSMQVSTTEQNRSEQRGARRIGPVVEYDLYVKDTIQSYKGRKRHGLAINGQVPAPTLRFTEGDSAVIHVHNLLKEEVSIHWHGVLLPNEEDGVPYLNTRPIKRGQSYTFRFRIIQNGTLWYHSHTMMQEQEGLYGPLVFYPAVQEHESNKMEEVLQLSDWRNESGGSIIRSLRRRNEWYAIKKKAVQSWGEALVKGHFGDKVQMEWTRMPGADLSDIYYPVFLMHGQPERTFTKYKAGDSVLLRVINGAAGSYFWLQYSGGKMKVLAADGNDVKPVEVDKLLIATAETYEIMIKIPGDGQYEFRATAQDITGHASAFFGSGTQQVRAKDIPPLDYMVLMNEMNKMTWAMKGMGMKMKMGLKMEMPEMTMNGMGNMNMGNGNMQNTDNMQMNNSDPMNMKGMEHNKADSTGMNMNSNSMQHGNMNMSDTMQDNMKDMDMKGMDHSNMPGIKKTSAPKKSSKKPTKKPAAKKMAPMPGMDHSKMNMGPKKAPAKKRPVKKTAPKKDPMEGMDHSKMKMGFAPIKNPFSYRPLTTSLYAASVIAPDMSSSYQQHGDTVPDKMKMDTSAMQGHDMHIMNRMNTDTLPRNNKQMHNMPENMNMQKPVMPGMDTVPKKMAEMDMHKNMDMQGMPMNQNNMQGMQGGMQMSFMNPGDTSRSYMLQTMMPKMPMTGFDFPPGNGNDVVLSYDMLRSDTMTALPKNRPWREIKLTLSGNMQRYIWSINGKTYAEQDTKYLVRKGENVRIVFTNATMMEHPMHLHGHFFRVINNQGTYAPMKHTFNINAMATQVIEFSATEEKDWFLHCHTLSHMINGMATVISYEGTVSEVQKAYPEGYRKFKKEHGGRLYPWANASFHTQGAFGTVVLSGRKFQFDGDWKWNYKKSYELEPRFQYYLDKRQFFSAFAGAEYKRLDVKNGKTQPQMESEKVATVGLIYTLPFFIDAEARIDHTGKFRFQVRREDFPLTTRTRLDLYYNTENEYGITARYIVAKYLAISANYDNQYGWGAGLSIIY